MSDLQQTLKLLEAVKSDRARAYQRLQDVIDTEVMHRRMEEGGSNVAN